MLFRSDEIRAAGIKELAETPSMNLQAAKAVFEYFHSVEEEANL